MCLTKLVKFRPCTVGYKVLIRNRYGGVSNSLYTEYMGSNGPLPIGIWIHEKDYRPYFLRQYNEPEGIKIDYTSFSYPFGFHVFHRKQDAVFWAGDSRGRDRRTIAKVIVKDVVATGFQKQQMGTEIRDLKVSVAKYIKIKETYEEW